MACLQQLETSQAQKSALRDQVQALQKELLAKVEQVRVISDDQVIRDFHTLVSMVRTLSRTMPVEDTIDIYDGLEPFYLLSNVPLHHWKSRVQKKRFVEAWIWSALLALIFQEPFLVFGEDKKDMTKIWTRMFGTEYHCGWPQPTYSSERWRVATAERLAELSGQNVASGGDLRSTAANKTIKPCKSRLNAKQTIEVHLEQSFPDGDLGDISRIVDAAAELAMQISLQRSRIQITYPDIGDISDNHTMSFAPNIDGDDIVEGVVACIVHPGLTK